MYIDWLHNNFINESIQCIQKLFNTRPLTIPISIFVLYPNKLSRHQRIKEQKRKQIDKINNLQQDTKTLQNRCP